MNALGFNEQQLQKMKNQPGFVAALDQSGGSTPKALAAYGIKEGSWPDEVEMFAIVHRMRTRIINSPSFNGLSLPTSFYPSIRFTPSHIHMSRCQPRQMVCQPGSPSPFLPMNPPM